MMRAASCPPQDIELLSYYMAGLRGASRCLRGQLTGAIKLIISAAKRTTSQLIFLSLSTFYAPASVNNVRMQTLDSSAPRSMEEETVRVNRTYKLFN